MMMTTSAPSGAGRPGRPATGFDILIAAGEDGLSLYSKGVFRIATVDLRDVVGGHLARTAGAPAGGVRRCRPVAVNVNASCSEMAVLVEVAARGEGGRDDLSLRLAIFRTHFSSPSVRSNILTSSSLSTAILSLLDSAAHEFRRSLARYRTAIGNFDGKLGALRRLLDEDGGGGAAGAGRGGANDRTRREMHACLLHGAADAPALSQWLSVDLGEGGLRRAAKQVDAATTELLKCVSGSVLRDCGELLFRVGELKSLAAAHAATAAAGGPDAAEPLVGGHHHAVGVGYGVELLERHPVDLDRAVGRWLADRYVGHKLHVGPQRGLDGREELVILLR